jgi:L-phenylalanine/L-methionine N-acetyltransferase
MTRKKFVAVELRAAESDDAPGVSALYRSPAVFGNLLQLPFPREAMWRERLANIDPDMLNLLALVDEQIVGHGYLGRPHPAARRRHVGVIGLAVHPDHQGRGIGSALLAAIVERAERWMQMIRLELEVYPDNSAAIALYRKHGFVEEGRLRAYAFRDGQYVDVLAMARVAAGYATQPEVRVAGKAGVRDRR